MVPKRTSLVESLKQNKRLVVYVSGKQNFSHRDPLLPSETVVSFLDRAQNTYRNSGTSRRGFLGQVARVSGRGCLEIARLKLG